MSHIGKKILMLGYRGKASHIASAQHAGVIVDLLIDKSEMKPAYENIFHAAYVVDDIYDWTEIEAVASANRYDAIFTRFEEFTTVVAALTDHLGLPGVAFADAPKFRNKYLMRKAFADHDVPSADFVLVQHPEEAKDFVAKHSFPLIVKQIAGFHSRYVAKVHNQAELESRIIEFLAALAQDTSLMHGKLHGYKEVIAPDPRSYVLVEECLTGEELTVDAFVVNGKIFSTPVCKYTMPEEMGIHDHYLPVRTMPYNISPEEEKIISTAVHEALHALGANYCVTHTEVFFDREKIECRLIEVASRGGGFRAEMLSHTSGADYDLGVMRAALGLDPDVTAISSSYAAVGEVFASRNGILEAIDYSCLEGQDDIHRLTINRKIGDMVGRASDGKSYILKFLVSADSYDAATDRAKELLLKIRNSVTVRQA
ncbi:MAG: ATP-grasp domain-containing protein [bacterium]|nr:ATP-grasp domain-containing protein [bacterium]